MNLYIIEKYVIRPIEILRKRLGANLLWFIFVYQLLSKISNTDLVAFWGLKFLDPIVKTIGWEQMLFLRNFIF